MQNGNSDRPVSESPTQNAKAQAEEPITEGDLARMESQGNVNALSRVLAVLVLMCVPGVLGHYLDRWLGTSFLMGAGFVIGMAIAISGLVYVSNLADQSVKETRELRQKLNRRKT
jgi:hypothetical protein